MGQLTRNGYNFTGMYVLETYSQSGFKNYLSTEQTDIRDSAKYYPMQG